MKHENRYEKKYKRRKYLTGSSDYQADSAWPLVIAAGLAAVHHDLTHNDGKNLKQAVRFGSECLFTYLKNKSEQHEHHK